MDELEASIAAASFPFSPPKERLPEIHPPFSGKADFPTLVASRREWIERVLRPWCRAADETSLRLAEFQWGDLAGQVSPDHTLWRWAWERFGQVIHPELGFDESRPWRLTLADGTCRSGYVNGRLSVGTSLFLVARDLASEELVTLGPFLIGEIIGIEGLEETTSNQP